jgi:hypothetical protein
MNFIFALWPVFSRQNLQQPEIAGKILASPNDNQ